MTHRRPGPKKPPVKKKRAKARVRKRPDVTNVRRLRIKRKLTRVQLAEAVGVSYRTIAAYEGGEWRPSYAVARLLATALECSIDDLYREVP